MILKSIKAEHTDKETGLVLKKIITSEGEYSNRKIAVNNSLFNSEQKRLINDKPILNTPFQIHHIQFVNREKVWNFEDIAISKAHAAKQERIYLAFQQRTEEQWDILKFSEAEADFQDLTTKGLTLMPYSIPMNSSLVEWKKRRADAISILNKSQALVPIFCSKHQINTFGDIFNYEFENSKLIGMQCYSLNDANTLLNLMKIKSRNMLLQTKDESPLLLGLSYGKVQKSFSNVSGSFAYSCFGFDILSERQTFLDNMPSEVSKKLLRKRIEEIMKYDRVMGGYTLSAEQEFWTNINITKEFLENVTVAEGLTQYQAIQWANYKGQQDDFEVLNSHILNTYYEDKREDALNYILSEKEKWAIYWKTQMPKLSIPKSLESF